MTPDLTPRTFCVLGTRGPGALEIGKYEDVNVTSLQLYAAYAFKYFLEERNYTSQDKKTVCCILDT